MIKALIVLSFFISSQTLFAQNNFKAMFYNVENLFDYFDDSTKNDNQFLPMSSRKWTKHRFEEKLNNISKVIVAVGENNLPEIVGLCELENSYCLFSLTQNTGLSKLKYSYIHYESPDKRGIDVALLYRKKMFSPVRSYPITVNSFDKGKIFSRDILYVKGYSKSLKDTIHVLVNHWPSRYGGQAKSDPKRRAFAHKLKNTVDSIFFTDQLANIIIMGDFNDNQNNKSISQILTGQNQNDSSLQNDTLLYLKPDNFLGTLKYNGRWYNFDMFFISLAFYQKYCPQSFIFDASFLLEQDIKHLGNKPFRTYVGFKYNGGFSDHLPIYLETLDCK